MTEPRQVVALGCPWREVRPRTAFCFADTYLDLARVGPVYRVGGFDCSSPGWARAMVAAQAFAIPDVTDLVMVDGDMTWSPAVLGRLLGHDAPFVGVAAPSRRDGKFKVGAPGKRGGELGEFTYDHKVGLAEIPRVGGCFTRIRRDCYEALMAAFPELHAPLDDLSDDANAWSYAFWQHKADGGGGWPTEDFGFCDLVRAAGMRVLVDPWIQLGHDVSMSLVGALVDSPEFAELFETSAA